jgi:hypothetical protein
MGKGIFSVARTAPSDTDKKKRSTVQDSTQTEPAGKHGSKTRVICGSTLPVFRWFLMACWKWFNGVLKDAGVQVTDANKQKIDDVIHHYIGEQASYGRCSSSWTTARKQINQNEEMRNELIAKLKATIK